MRVLSDDAAEGGGWHAARRQQPRQLARGRPRRARQRRRRHGRPTRQQPILLTYQPQVAPGASAAAAAVRRRRGATDAVGVGVGVGVVSGVGVGRRAEEVVRVTAPLAAVADESPLRVVDVLVEVGEGGRAAGARGAAPRAARPQHVLLDVREVSPPEVKHAPHHRVEVVDQRLSLRVAVGLQLHDKVARARAARRAEQLAVTTRHVALEGGEHPAEDLGAHADADKGVAQRQDARHGARRAAQPLLALHRADLVREMRAVRRQVGQPVRAALLAQLG